MRGRERGKQERQEREREGGGELQDEKVHPSGSYESKLGPFTPGYSRVIYFYLCE